ARYGRLEAPQPSRSRMPERDRRRGRHDQLVLAIPGSGDAPAEVAVSDLVAPSAGPPSASPVAEILEGLTDEQTAAVTHGAGPLLIVAGAGTGKTTVITRRIAHLITTRLARPEQILALTFTDRAAAEMEERVDRLVPYGFTQAWISTFHAFGDRVLREH